MKITIESRGELPNNCKGWVVKIEDGEYVQETAFSFFEEAYAFLKDGSYVEDTDLRMEGLADKP